MFFFCSYYFLVCIVEGILAETRIGENIFNNNGWTPITREKVYSSFDERLFPKGKVAEARNQSTNDLGYSQSGLEDLKYARIFAQPSYMNLDNSFMSSQISSNSADFENHEDTNNEYLMVSNAKRPREPKAILSGNIQLMDANYQQEKMFTEKVRKDKVQPSIIDHEKQYQVIESEEQKERSEKQDNETIKHLVIEPTNNHFDVINKIEEDGADITPNELTDKLLSILSSYNIRVNDKLTNYDLSRHSGVTTRNPAAQKYMLVPIPLRLSNRYNSLNHLPVDPLLAVLLSNYGYYLPGQYGINNKYYNLYGYLASNNIHNNKPFGSYKIFADTDSWN